MKQNTKTDGAGHPAGTSFETHLGDLPQHGAFSRARLEAYEAEREARKEEARKKAYRASRKLTIEVDAFTYGSLCAAGVVHDTAPEVAAAILLKDHAANWSNQDFIIDED
jgi:hypothetical protein